MCHFGAREDNTNIPYDFVRRLKFNGTALTSGILKLRWGILPELLERALKQYSFNVVSI